MTADNTSTASNSVGRGVIHMLFRAMVGAYALSTLLFTFLWWITDESWIVVAAFIAVAHLAWLLALILLPIMFILRDWWVSLLLIPLAILFLVFYASKFLPNRSQPIPDDAETITLATYNMWGFNERSDEIIDAILELDADIIGLQELSFDNAAAIESNLIDDYPHQALHPNEVKPAGNGLISRYPITEDEFWQYEFLITPLGHQRSTIELDESTTIIVYNTHTTPPIANEALYDTSFRSREIEVTMQRLANEPDEIPLIWLGDFNMPELTDDYQEVTAVYNDSYARVGTNFGWTLDYFHTESISFPMFRIDYIFYTDELTPLQSSVSSNSGYSDHHPVVTIFQLNRPPSD